MTEDCRELEGTTHFRLYFNKVFGRGPRPRWHGGAVIGTVPPRQGLQRLMTGNPLDDLTEPHVIV
jgi:hypothetical protein